MKKFLQLFNSFPNEQQMRTRALILLTASLAAVFWSLSIPSALAGTNNCVVCHKRTQTIFLACNSLEYRRHLDHGDPPTPCPGTAVETKDR